MNGLLGDRRFSAFLSILAMLRAFAATSTPYHRRHFDTAPSVENPTSRAGETETLCSYISSTLWGAFLVTVFRYQYRPRLRRPGRMRCQRAVLGGRPDAAKDVGIEEPCLYVGTRSSRRVRGAGRARARTRLARPTNMVAQYLLPNTQSARRVYGQCRRSSNSPGCTFRVPAANFTSCRPLLGVENLISAIIFALNNPVTIGEPHVVQHFQLMTIGEILTMLRKMQGRSLSTVFSSFC